jgi:hypothetical protein
MAMMTCSFARMSGVLLLACSGLGLGLSACASRSLEIDKDGRADLDSLSEASPALLPVDFITGNWRSIDKDGLSEEIWSQPHGSSMVGVFRIADADGSLRLEEALAITAEPSGVYLRVRHFDAKMTAREEKDAPIVLKLESSAENRAVFRKVSGSASLDTITYERKGQILNGDVAFTPESKREALKFAMRRGRIESP